MYDLIASQFLDDYLLLRPGSPSGIKIGSRRHRELERAAGQPCPTWLVDAVRRRWPDLDLTDRRVDQAVLVRAISPFGYGRASYELNLGCNYDCATTNLRSRPPSVPSRTPWPTTDSTSSTSVAPPATTTDRSWSASTTASSSARSAH